MEVRAWAPRKTFEIVMASQLDKPKPALHVAVGSKNPVKLNATRAGFSQMFPGRSVHVHGYAVPSGVPDQPVGHQETLQGAVNRALVAAAAHNSATKIDFSVGLEGGVVLGGGLQMPVQAGAAAVAPGLPAPQQAAPAAEVPTPLTEPTLSCFAYMAVLHCGSGKWGHASTGSFPLPPPVTHLLLQGVELGKADDQVFKRSNSKQHDGAVGLLTHGVIDRTVYYVHALVLALTAFVHPEHYGTPQVQGHLGEAETDKE